MARTNTKRTQTRALAAGVARRKNQQPLGTNLSGEVGAASDLRAARAGHS